MGSFAYETTLATLKGVKLPVLDDGFVRLVDWMGDDKAIVQAARVSYGEGTKTINEDEGLIRYLMSHKHTSPFEMCEIKLHVRVPMDVWRQWIRHRTASVNEYSTRYSVAIDSAHKTPPDGWRKQATGNKQGSGDFFPASQGAGMCETEKHFHGVARQLYNERIANGVAREQARKDLPLSTYTEAFWKIDLHNLLHFLRLRMDSHAQQEIRAYADNIAYIVEKWVPLTWRAWYDYVFGALTLSLPEQRAILLLSEPNLGVFHKHAALYGWDKPKSREREEFRKKLETLGLPDPWKGDKE